MPIHRVSGGFKWGSRGKVYKTKEGAARQAKAAYANGYKERPSKRVRKKNKKASQANKV